MSWITQLPAGVLYTGLGVIGLTVIGVVWLATLTLLRGGKVSAGPVVLEAEDEHTEVKS